ncbi:phage tail sheath family protein [Pseudonocardia sp.]|uniref:phage tail sheath family protein n=1 Tax=Pseudonocardia sp. TaxID=60912 RepID=UPI003D0F6A42
MPVVTSWPGVYVEESPSGARSIPTAATSVTAFVGRARRGPVGEPVSCTSWGDFQRRFGGLWVESELGYAVAQFFDNGGGQAVVSRVGAGAESASTSVRAATGPGKLDLVAAEPGGWGRSLRVTVSHGTPATVTATDDTTFHLVIEEVDPVAEATLGAERAILTRETFPQVSVDPAARRYVGRVLEQQSRLARTTEVPALKPRAVERQTFDGGSDGSAAEATDPETGEAIDALDHADLVNLLCVPPLDRDTPTTPGTWSYALGWAERHRAVLLVDPPPEWADAATAARLAGRTNLRSTNAAFYFPRIVGPDPLQRGLTRPFAPSGAVAGVLSRTDAERGVWKAPAGTDARLVGVDALEQELTDADSGVLNPSGVNALRRLTAVGPVVWGARTGRGADVMASEWKYLPVRRLALHIENSLARGTQWAVFEPNAEPLWAELRLSVTTFLHDLFRSGAFAGTTPREAYLVRCDATTTTQADVDTGVVRIVVGFAPLRPAEFVMLQFVQLAGAAA